MGEVSTEDIQKIVNNFLLSAPPGEFHEVVTDVRGLLQNDTLLNEIAPGTFKQYNTDQMLSADSGKGHKVLITKFGEVNENEYVDPQGGQVLSYDHFKQEVTGTREISGELDDAVEPYRAAFEKKILEYQANHYDFGVATVYGSKEGSNHVVTIAISSALFNSANFYNGRWRSLWSVKFAPGKKADLEGTIKINVHYYEDGNVQLITNCNRKKQGIAATNPEALADAAIKSITEIETEFQNQLELSYDKMGNTTFKALRRALPITQTKIVWPKIANMKMGADAGPKKTT